MVTLSVSGQDASRRWNGIGADRPESTSIKRLMRSHASDGTLEHTLTCHELLRVENATNAPVSYPGTLANL